MILKSSLCGVLALLCEAGASAQEANTLEDPGQKSVRVVRTDAPPLIDGLLDDAVWQTAALIDNLHQVNPVEYAEPSEPTEIYLLYDDDALYVAARMYVSDGDEVTANVLRQGASITGDDTLFVTLDPFNSRRSGYFFGVNPNAVRFDGLYRNVSEYYSDWDGIFDAKTSRFDGGWIVEYEIPFKTLSFDPNMDTWGLNFSRTIQRRNEDMAWVTRNRSWDPSSAGLASGLEGLEQGIGLDVVPSASLRSSRDLLADITDSSFEPSFDLAYKITPALNGSLTVNTDFSATEVDDRQVNLTRFNLFFPEKRDFFLREADIFEFGRIGAQNGNGSVSGAAWQNGRPFFSRRIGLGGSGEVVDLEYGGKISGRVGRWEVGALSIKQDEYAAVEAETLSVMRAKANVLDESTLGIVFTEGDPRSDVDNSVAGIDFLYRNTRLPGGLTLEAEAWYQQSDTDGLIGGDSAAGVGITIPSNTGFRGGVSVKEFGESFNPALGFISRQGIRDYSSHLAYTLRPEDRYWQSAYFAVQLHRIEGLAGGLQSQRIGITPFEITSRNGDVIFARSNLDKEVLTEPYEISPGVIIPAGDYSWSDSGAEFRAAGHRKVSGRIAMTHGNFYTGELTRLFGNATWQPSARFRANIGFNINDVELPEGDFTTRIVTAGLDFVLSSTLSWVNLIQYDNVSETMGFNMRLHWIPEAGREIFFVINHKLEDFDRDNTFNSASSDVTAKVNYTFRF